MFGAHIYYPLLGSWACLSPPLSPQGLWHPLGPSTMAPGVPQTGPQQERSPLVQLPTPGQGALLSIEFFFSIN